jgi:poly(A) polymerase Pap1
MLTAFVVGYLVLTALTAVGYWNSYSRDGVLRNKFFGLIVFTFLFAPLCGLYWIASMVLALTFFVLLRSEAILRRVILDTVFGRRDADVVSIAVSRTRQHLRSVQRREEKMARRASRAGMV